MGNYITQTDIENRIGEERLIELTDDDGLNTVNTTVLDQLISEAEGEVDGYLCKQYSVPLPSPPAIIKAICLDIVVYRLYGRREGTPEDVEKRYQNAIRYLEKVSKNQVSLGIDTLPPESPNEGGPQSVRSKEDRVFTIGDDSESGTLDDY